MSSIREVVPKGPLPKGTPEGVAQRAREEAGWVARLKAGEEQAFEELLARYQDQVFGVVCHWLGNEEEAKDVTQETFVRAFTQMKAFRGESSLRSWLFAIARNACRNTFRTWARKRRAMTDPLDSDLSEDGAPLQLADPGLSALETLEQGERLRMVRDALQTLEPDFRQVVTLCDMEGVTYEEAADVCECPVGTVRSRLHRGRMLLKRRLQVVLGGTA